MTRRGDQFEMCERRVATSRLAWFVALVVTVWAGVLPQGQARAAELIMFNEAGCVWCRRFDAEIGPIYSKTAEGQIAPLRRIDISQARTSGLRLVRGVTSTPTFVLVEDGAELGRITGYPGEDFFWGLLSEMLGKLKAKENRSLRDARGHLHDVRVAIWRSADIERILR